MTQVQRQQARMLPAPAYTSPEVLSWELRQLYAGSWCCLGRSDELLPYPQDTKPVTQRAVVVGDVPALLVRGDEGIRMFANTCRHRGHELLGTEQSSERRSITCPYHAWTYDLNGSLVTAPGFRDDPYFEPAEHELVELPVVAWGGWLFGHALHPVGDDAVPVFAEHLG